MKERIKTINYPTLLLLVVSLVSVKNVFYSLRYMLGGHFGILNFISFMGLLCPIALFLLLFFKEDEKRLIGAASVFFGIFTLIDGMVAVPKLFAYGLFNALVEGPLFSALSDVLIGLLLLIMGAKLIKNKAFTKKYYFLCGLCIFSLAYGSMFTAFSNPMVIINKLPTVLYALALWFVPKLYAEAETERAKVKFTGKKVFSIAVVVFIMYVILTAITGSSGSSGSVSGKPWKELGVSEREYMEVYNYYKYGKP